MKFFTVYACSDRSGLWLAIDQSPALPAPYANEVRRLKLYRPGIVIGLIITEHAISDNDAIGLINMAFSDPSKWVTTQFEKSAHNQQIRDKATGRGKC